MPSSGYPIENLFQNIPITFETANLLIKRAELAMEHGLFIEWLESFIGAWNATKDPLIASMAGLDEWDM